MVRSVEVKIDSIPLPAAACFQDRGDCVYEIPLKLPNRKEVEKFAFKRQGDRFVAVDADKAKALLPEDLQAIELTLQIANKFFIGRNNVTRGRVQSMFEIADYVVNNYPTQAGQKIPEVELLADFIHKLTNNPAKAALDTMVLGGLESARTLPLSKEQLWRIDFVKGAYHFVGPAERGINGLVDLQDQGMVFDYARHFPEDTQDKKKAIAQFKSWIGGQVDDGAATWLTKRAEVFYDIRRMYDYGVDRLAHAYLGEGVVYDEAFIQGYRSFVVLEEKSGDSSPYFGAVPADAEKDPRKLERGYCNLLRNMYKELALPKSKEYQAALGSGLGDELASYRCENATSILKLEGDWTPLARSMHWNWLTPEVRAAIAEQETRNQVLGVVTKPIEELYGDNGDPSPMKAVVASFAKAVQLKKEDGEKKLFLSAKAVQATGASILQNAPRTTKRHYEIALRAFLEYLLIASEAEKKYFVLEAGQIVTYTLELEDTGPIEDIIEQQKGLAARSQTMTHTVAPITEAVIAVAGVVLLVNGFANEDSDMQYAGGALAGAGVGGLTAFVSDEGIPGVGVGFQWSDNDWVPHLTGLSLGAGLGLGTICLVRECYKQDNTGRQGESPPDPAQRNWSHDFGP
ncbi:MAG: hypothetical protein HYU97_00180 [Deltaproteobacteria bacterium]|nr:hypothetical protein [Deltaproteobacteria bacterium]